MSNVQLFQHPDFGSLTTFKDNNGKEYYKAHDVCIALRLSNPSQQIKRHVKSKWVFEFDDGYSNSGKALYLSEPGFNALIFRSKTPQAEAFQDWVFEEVLPKLRASGYYIAPTATSEQLEQAQKEIGKLQRELKYYNAEYGNAEETNFKIKRQRLINEECAIHLMDRPNEYRMVKTRVDTRIAKGECLNGLIPFEQSDYYASLRKKA